MKNKLLPVFMIMMLSSCGTNVESSTVSTDPINEETYDIALPIFFDTKDAKQEISKNIYGTFIEHIEACIYNGIWSEMILDRKFYDPVGKDTSQWKKSGEVTNNTTDYVSAPNATDIHANASIYQSGIALDENADYEGYIYAKGQGTLKISFANANETIEEEIIVSSSNLTKYPFIIHSNTKNKKTKLTIESLTSTITVDSMSLMPSNNYYGMRRDTLDLLKNLNAPFYRWPGGNFVSGYDFEDGIGNRDERVCKRNLHYCGLESNFKDEDERLANDLMKIGSLGFYGAIEPNDYGIDEFIKMCEYLNAEPNIVVNSGLGSAQEAANEVAYCNATSGEYASKRQQKEPYNVKYFSIGNEMNGSWQLGHVDINEYVNRHNQFYNAMKAIDPNIEIIGVGDNWSDWSAKMLQSTQMDYISEHFYGERNETDSNAHILSLKKQAEERIKRHRSLNPSNVFISFDEYAYENAEGPSRLKDGMGVALALNTYIKNADVVKIACYSSTINATQGSITTDKYNAYMQGNGYALMLYRNNLLNVYQPVTYQASKINGVFEVIGTINSDKSKLTLAIVNSSNKTIKLTNDVFKSIVSRKYVTADFLDDYDQADSSKFRYIEEDDVSSAIVKPNSITTIEINL